MEDVIMDIDINELMTLISTINQTQERTQLIGVINIIIGAFIILSFIYFRFWVNSKLKISEIMDKRYKTYFDITEKEIDKVVKKYKNYETQLKKARSTIEILQKDSIKRSNKTVRLLEQYEELNKIYQKELDRISNMSKDKFAVYKLARMLAKRRRQSSKPQNKGNATKTTKTQ